MRGVVGAVPKTATRAGVATVVLLLLSLSFLAAGCETYTLESDLFMATRSKRNVAFNSTAARAQYSLGFALGKETQTVVFLPLSREQLPPDVTLELLDKAYLEIPLWVRSQEAGSAAFGVYRILEDWRQKEGLPSGLVPPEWPDDDDMMLINLMSHWPLSTETDPAFTFTLTYDPTPKVIIIGPAPSASIRPSYPEQVLRLELTELVKKWLREEANYGILIQPLPGQYVPSETYWWQQKDKKPRLILVFRTSAGQQNNPPAVGNQ